VNVKPTTWTKISAGQCAVLACDHGALRIAHPELPRPVWFNQSHSGNWYWRDTGTAADSHARGYIITGDVATLDRRHQHETLTVTCRDIEVTYLAHNGLVVSRRATRPGTVHWNGWQRKVEAGDLLDLYEEYVDAEEPEEIRELDEMFERVNARRNRR